MNTLWKHTTDFNLHFRCFPSELPFTIYWSLNRNAVYLKVVSGLGFHRDETVNFLVPQLSIHGPLMCLCRLSNKHQHKYLLNLYQCRNRLSHKTNNTNCSLGAIGKNVTFGQNTLSNHNYLPIDGQMGKGEGVNRCLRFAENRTYIKV
jgi:hypothetical protein